MYARPIPVQTKVHFKILQFLAVMYDMFFFLSLMIFSCNVGVVRPPPRHIELAPTKALNKEFWL